MKEPGTRGRDGAQSSPVCSERITCCLPTVALDSASAVMNLEVEGKQSAVRRAILALILMSFIWGYNWVLVKEAMRYAPPFDFSAIRTIGGGILLLGVLAGQGRSLRPQNIPMTLLVGITCTTFSVGFATWALVE